MLTSVTMTDISSDSLRAYRAQGARLNAIRRVLGIIFSVLFLLGIAFLIGPSK